MLLRNADSFVINENIYFIYALVKFENILSIFEY